MIFDIKNINSTVNQKRFIINKEDIEISATKRQILNNTTIYLLHKSKNRVHNVFISVRDKNLYSLLEIQQLVNDVLDSFVAN